MLLALALPALAAPPENPSLSAMTEHAGRPVLDRTLLAESWEVLVAEIGTSIAPPPLPSATTGTYGFEVALSSTFAVRAASVKSGGITAWDRAVPDEEATPFFAMPTLSARKGLPGGLEVGGRMGWVAGSQTGFGSVFGRLAVLQNYKPLPDLTFQVGYSGYVGNDEIDLSTFDAGVTVGGRYGVGGRNGQNGGRFEPFVSFGLLRVSATPTASDAVIEATNARTYRRGQGANVPLSMYRVGAGAQVTSGVVHFRLAAAWSWKTLPTFDVGMGVTF